MCLKKIHTSIHVCGNWTLINGVVPIWLYIRRLCLPMGCSASIAPLHQHEDSDHIGVRILDSRQRRIVEETWRQLQPERVNIGKQVFLNAFENDPRIKTVFKLESARGDSLLTNADFQTQSTRCVDVIGFVVDNVDCLNTICEPYLLRIGGIHAAMAGFSVDYIDEFGVVFCMAENTQE